MKLEETFKTVDTEKNEIELLVRRPDDEALNESTKVFFDTFNHAKNVLKSPLRLQNQNQLKELGIWTEDKDKQLDKLEKDIKKSCIKLTKVKNKKEGRNLALKIRELRTEYTNLISEQNYLDDLTCESQANNKKMDYWVSACTFYSDTLEPFFSSLEDFTKRRNEKAANDAYTAMLKLMFDLDANPQKKNPENQFLLKHKMCNDDLYLVDSDGNLCDRDYKKIKLVNNLPYYVNDKDEIVDDEGNLLNEDGSLKLDFPDLDE